MKRTYQLAADPERWADGLLRRAILEITDDSHRETLLIVADSDAMDVLDAIRRVYQDGREDNAPHYHCATGTEDTPCWCPSPGTYAPQGNSEYSTEEEAEDGLRECFRCGDRVGYLSSRDLCDGCEAELITEVPMVCPACRKPVMRSGEDWVHVYTRDIGACPHNGPVKAMIAAGNEKISTKEGASG